MTASADVALYAPEKNSITAGLLKETNRQLRALGIQELLVTADKAQIQSAPEQFSAVVAVGSRNAYELSSLSSLPLISVYISSLDATELGDRLTSAIYAEPPFNRQVMLAQEIFGAGERFGALTENSIPTGPFAGKVSLYPVADYPSLNHGLIRLLGDSRALIGTYDPELYSADNIKSILITSYRHNRALIGPSGAYLRAGALASTFSSSDDVALRLAEILAAGIREGRYPAAGYNPYFHVGFNEQVGRSLNLLLPDADVTAERIRTREAGK
ncbi:MAG: hypothetical protein VW258_01665 [Thalassolituus sp.]